jgi:putative inorganic carbon (hco3(-)) transporter
MIRETPPTSPMPQTVHPRFRSKRRSLQMPANASGAPDRSLWALEIPALWRALRREPAVFWLLCLYMVVEYLRLQVVYPALNVVPWGKVSLAVCFAALALLGGGRFRRLSTMDGLVAAFFFWVLLSALFAWRPEVALAEWAGVISWLALYILVTHVVTTPRRLFLFFLAFFLVNLKMSQHGARTLIRRGFSFAEWGATGSPGWFQNSGEFAMQMAAFLGISWCVIVALRPHLARWKLWALVAILPSTAALSVLASSSRGGQLAGAAVVLAIMLVSRVRLRRIALVGLVLAAGWYLMPPEQKARFEVMGEDDTSQSRLTYWAHSLRVTQEHPIFGIGYRNWIPYIRQEAQLPPLEVHNTVLQAAVELGFPGALLFLAMVGLSFRMNRMTRRRARRLGPWGGVMSGMALGLDMGMLGLFIAGLFMSVLFYPVFWMAFAMTVALSEGVRRPPVRLSSRGEPEGP